MPFSPETGLNRPEPGDEDSDYQDRRCVMAKKGFHPVYKPAKITCACGMEYETYSTRGDYMVEICSNCHPFYTGKQKLVDSAGRVERFNRKYGRSTPS